MYTKTEFCKNAGISPETLRHYLDIGLLQPKVVTESGYRKFDRDSILDLWFYRLGAALGNPLKTIKDWKTSMSLEYFSSGLREREKQLEQEICALEQQLSMIREIRHYTDRELSNHHLVTVEEGRSGYRAFCEGGPAAQAQIARLAELFPMVSIEIDYQLPTGWECLTESAIQEAKTPLYSRLGICLMEDRKNSLDLTDTDGLEYMPAMESLCMPLITPEPFQLTTQDFMPLLLHLKEHGLTPKSDIIASLFCREAADSQTLYLLKCRILI